MPDGSMRSHLYIVLIDPSPENLVLIATCSSIKDDDTKYDKTTILNVGCHPFITKKSYIRHDLTDIMDVAHIKRKIEQGAEMSEPLDSSIVDRILNDTLIGGRTRRWVKKWYQEYLDNRMFDALKN